MSTPPLPDGIDDDRRSNVANRVHSVAIHLLRNIRTVDSETGLTPARLAALSVLVFGGPKTVSELAAIEMVSVPAVTRLVKALEAEGLVSRTVGSDRRLAIISATDSARTLMEQARRRRLQKFRDLLAPLSDAQVATLEEAAGLLETELAQARR